MRGTRDDLKTMVMDERGIVVSCGKSLIFNNLEKPKTSAKPVWQEQNQVFFFTFCVETVLKFVCESCT